MKKADKFSLVMILVLFIYMIFIFLLNQFAINPKLIEFLTIFVFMIVLLCVFIFIGYLTIKTKKYSRNQKIFLSVLLIIICFIDIILLIIAAVSGLIIYGFILGIFNCISLGIFGIILSIIKSK